MDKSLKDKWISTLRSGEYTQGPTRLHNSYTGTYCCLGVLCEVIGLKKDDLDYFFDEVGTFCSSYIPRDYCEIIGLPYVTSLQLAAMNDGDKTPQQNFNEIADYIQNNVDENGTR